MIEEVIIMFFEAKNCYKINRADMFLSTIYQNSMSSKNNEAILLC